MLPRILMGLSAGVILVLGILHLVYTFFGPKLRPRDAELQSAMQAVSPVITTETTMWKAWVGFNASHSLGAILFGRRYWFSVPYRGITFSLACYSAAMIASWFMPHS